ncbi:unnamed protein product, partial [Ectocarpus sp. 6 AP-2014]
DGGRSAVGGGNLTWKSPSLDNTPAAAGRQQQQEQLQQGGGDGGARAGEGWAVPGDGSSWAGEGWTGTAPAAAPAAPVAATAAAGRGRGMGGRFARNQTWVREGLRENGR